MANLNWGGALTTGLIEAGKGLQNIGAMRMKEEYLAEEKASAATAATQSKYEFLYKENNDEIAAILKGGEFGQVSPEDKKRVANLRHTNTILAKSMFGIPVEDKDSNRAKVGDILEAPESGESEAGDGLIKKFTEYLRDKIFSRPGAEQVNMLTAFAKGIEGEGDRLADVIASVKLEYPDITKEGLALEVYNRMYTGDVPGSVDPSGFTGGFKEVNEPEEEMVSESTNRSYPGLFPESMNRSLDNYREGSDKKQGEDADQVRDRITPGKIDAAQQGLIEQGTATTEQEATMAAGGELGGSGYVETPIMQETVSDISGVVGSEEALTSLFRDVGGPVGEPAGTTDILTRSNIPEESPEIESTKSRIISSLTQLILSAESNVNGYNAVAGSTEGDPNLTNMTVGEIVEKYGNTAVGAGQFKYEEFTVPIAKKYLNMGEPELRAQVFTQQFQNDLIALGLEDAGLTLIAKQEISLEEFQKRVANIWRGLPPTKQTQEGESTDTYGNKARVSGGLLYQAIGAQ